MSDHLNGNKKRKRIMRSFKMLEISAVDRPAQSGAKAVIMKRADQSDTFSKLDGSVALTNAVSGAAHTIDLSGINFITGEERVAKGGHTSFQDGHSHPWIMTAEGEVIIGAEDGHTHIVQEISKSTVSDGIPRVVEKEINMPNAQTPEEIQKAHQEKLDALQKQLDLAHKITALNAVSKAYYDALDDTGKGVFIAKSTDEQQTAIKVAEVAKVDQNPVIYTDANGSAFRKNDDPRLVAMAKKADADAKENDFLRKNAIEQDMRKRADTLLSDMPGNSEVKYQLLKAAESIEDKDAREGAIAALKSQNATMANVYQTVGHSVVKAADGSPEAELDQLADDYAKQHNVTEAVAMDKVTQTPKGEQLYNKAFN